eukprot:jgi/Psemu1/61313/gm1.61313_g
MTHTRFCPHQSEHQSSPFHPIYSTLGHPLRDIQANLIFSDLTPIDSHAIY